LLLTSKAENIEFGSITRTLDSGTETLFLLKVTDIFGSEFRYLLGSAEDFSRDTMDEAAIFFNEWAELMGFDVD
jgi:hypothetical protein